MITTLGKFAASLLLFAGFISGAHAQSADWQKTWDETVAAAKKEGKVVVLGQPSPAMRNVILPKFTERFGIQVEHIAGRSSEIVPKIRTERESGIYSVDVFMSNAGTSIGVLYGEKMVDPLKPLLILPEVTDGSKWKRGEPWFVDPGKEYILLLFSSVDSLMVINTDYVKLEEMRSAKNLLNPKWKGKISTENPQASGGGGAGSAAHFYTQFGPEFVKQLYIGQEAVVQRDRRVLTDWLARGSHPICLTCHIDDMRALLKEGYPLLEVFELSDIQNRITPAPSLLTVANKAPHPNAAKVFVNWMAGKEALELYSREAQAATMRTDVDESFLDPRVIPKPGVKYVDYTDFNWVATGRREVAKKVQELLKTP
ncbi:MAG: ABC transporter substrate-binding protein [Xanthobacteraceae bacterium]